MSAVTCSKCKICNRLYVSPEDLNEKEVRESCPRCQECDRYLLNEGETCEVCEGYGTVGNFGPYYDPESDEGAEMCPGCDGTGFIPQEYKEK